MKIYQSSDKQTLPDVIKHYAYFPHAERVTLIRGHVQEKRKDMLEGVEFYDKTFIEMNLKHRYNAREILRVADQFKMTPQERHHFLVSLAVSGPYYIHMDVFMPPLKFLGSDEQVKKWIPLAESGLLLGSYSQTEMAHGSDVQELGSTAVYDAETDEFVLNTPTLQSIKVWPGNLGYGSTHTLFFAQTRVNGKNCGVQTFMVPIRDLKTQEKMPGVELGDIGPKLGQRSNDNGWLRLTNVRIPRENMLSRFMQVEKGGNNVTTLPPMLRKLAYAGMLNLRVVMGRVFAYETAVCALNLYDAAKKMEKFSAFSKIMTEEACTAYSMAISNFFASYKFINLLTKLHHWISIKKLDKEFDNLLKELHILSSAFKAQYSYECVKLNSNINRMISLGALCLNGNIWKYNNFVPGLTYEGDNSVLLQQTAREILKMFNNIEDAKGVNSFHYFGEWSDRIASGKAEDYLQNLKKKLDDQNSLIEILEYSHFLDTKRIAERLVQVVGNQGLPFARAWNETLQKEVIQNSLLYIWVYRLKCFRDEFQNMKELGVLLEHETALRDIFWVSIHYTFTEFREFLIRNVSFDSAILQSLEAHRRIITDRVLQNKDAIFNCLDIYPSNKMATQDLTNLPFEPNFQDNLTTISEPIAALHEEIGKASRL